MARVHIETALLARHIRPLCGLWSCDTVAQGSEGDKNPGSPGLEKDATGIAVCLCGRARPKLRPACPAKLP